MQVVNIHVFGRTLKLNCPADQVEALNLAAKDLDERLNGLRDKTQVANNDQLIISIALNLAYELAIEKQKNNEIGEFKDRLKNLQELLDNALHERKV